jgi:hypothetical protein
MLVPVNGKKLEEFTVLQLVGFLILFIGVIFYNEMIAIPFCGLNKYTKEAIAERERPAMKKENQYQFALIAD